jgi:hypothetical protein
LKGREMYSCKHFSCAFCIKRTGWYYWESVHENPHRNLNATDPGSNNGVHIFRVHALNVAAATLQKVRTLQKGTDHAITGF